MPGKKQLCFTSTCQNPELVPRPGAARLARVARPFWRGVNEAKSTCIHICKAVPIAVIRTMLVITARALKVMKAFKGSAYQQSHRSGTSYFNIVLKGNKINK